MHAIANAIDGCVFLCVKCVINRSIASAVPHLRRLTELFAAKFEFVDCARLFPHPVKRSCEEEEERERRRRESWREREKREGRRERREREVEKRVVLGRFAGL